MALGAGYFYCDAREEALSDKFRRLRRFLSGRLMGLILVLLGLILLACLVGLFLFGAFGQAS